MFIPKSDVLWICLLINNTLRDKIYNYKGRCQPGHLPDFFVGGELLHIRPRGELTKVQKDCFLDAWRPSLIPPSPSGKGSIYFPRKKFTSQPFLDSSEFFRGIISRIKKLKGPPKKPDISPVGTSLALLLLCHGVVLSPLLSCLCSLITIWKCECAGWDLSGYY